MTSFNLISDKQAEHICGGLYVRLGLKIDQSNTNTSKIGGFALASKGGTSTIAASFENSQINNVGYFAV